MCVRRYVIVHKMHAPSQLCVHVSKYCEHVLALACRLAKRPGMSAARQVIMDKHCFQPADNGSSRLCTLYITWLSESIPAE